MEGLCEVVSERRHRLACVSRFQCCEAVVIRAAQSAPLGVSRFFPSAVALLVVAGCAHDLGVRVDGICEKHLPAFRAAPSIAIGLGPVTGCEFMREFADQSATREDETEGPAGRQLADKYCRCRAALAKYDPPIRGFWRTSNVDAVTDPRVWKMLASSYGQVGPVGTRAGQHLLAWVKNNQDLPALSKMAEKDIDPQGHRQASCVDYQPYWAANGGKTAFEAMGIALLAQNRIQQVEARQHEEQDAARQREEAERQAAEERTTKWGRDIKEWGTREENQHVYRLLRSLLINVNKLKGLKAEWDAEKQKNDESETEDEVVPAELVPDQIVSRSLFPEVSGSFTFVKILDQFQGEALFEAADGLFVLRLSPGDSFRASPGESVVMTVHNRGGTVLMTSGQRLPVFMSGNSPAQIRNIPGHHTPERRKLGHHPNRSKERALRKELETLGAALEKRYLEIAEPLSGGLLALKDAPAGVKIVIAGSSSTRIDKVVIGGPSPVYCIGVETPCAENQTVSLSLDEFIGK